MMSREGGSAPEIQTIETMLARMREGTREVYEIRMRGMVFPVRLLSLDETNEIRRFSKSEAARGGGDSVDANVEMQKASLRLASTLTDRGVPVISDALLKRLTTDEVNFLFEEYVAILDSVNPSVERIPDDEFRALVDALKKSLITSRDCSLRQLRAICTSFADDMRSRDQAGLPPGN